MGVSTVESGERLFQEGASFRGSSVRGSVTLLFTRSAEAAEGSGRVERAESRQSLKNTPSPFREKRREEMDQQHHRIKQRDNQLRNHHGNTTRPGRPLLSTPQNRGNTKSGTKALQSHGDL
ncbi:hypothetical protein MHYP_G00346850 [Metynnis hypsauchen]